VKGSQFDTDNDKNLFFWMFEKRTISLVNPKKTEPALKSEWNLEWPCFFNCGEPDQSPADSKAGEKTEDATKAVAEEDIPLVIWLTGTCAIVMY
jgi:hypothetical protein